MPDESTRRADPWIAAGLALATLLLSVPALTTPAYWDEMGFLQQAGWLSDNHLFRVLPGTRPAAQFWGHPPGLHLTGAIVFKLFGASIVAAHAITMCFAAVGVAATYLVARLQADVTTATLAALLLLLSPAYLAQAGLFQADLPVTAVAMVCVYLAFTGRYLAYLVCGAYLVMLKETAMAPVVAIAAYRALESRVPYRARAREALRYAAPLVVIGSFIALQKTVTGQAFFIYDFETDPFRVTSVGAIVSQASEITRWIFVEQGRWLLSIAIVLFLLRDVQARRDPFLRLFILVLLLSGYTFSVLFFTRRYLLPVLPFLTVAGATALMSFAGGSRHARGALSAAAVSFAVLILVGQPMQGSSENNLQFRRNVQLHQRLADTLAATWPTARILTAWPVGTELGDPLNGYVRQAMRIVWYEPGQALPLTDLAVVSNPGNPQTDSLSALAQRRGWPLLFELRDGSFMVRAHALPAGEGAPQLGSTARLRNDESSVKGF